MGDHSPKNAATRQSSRSSVASSKEAVATVSELVNLGGDGEDGVDDIQEDIEHGVAHPVSSLNELADHIDDLDTSWETESLLADMLDTLSDENPGNGKRAL